MPETKSSLIFIPDISGFTEFVNQTEISHSQHIISELLELLIDADELNMKVAEIEGDAIVFYKDSEMPPFQKLIDQVVNMFINFHEHLRRYESQRICECGACSTAGKLSLKFITHQGPIGYTTIKNSTKPFGTTMVIAHRLLKNDVPGNEYLLISDTFFKQDASEVKIASNLGPFLSGMSTYDNLGQVNYKYLNLSKLHNQVQDPKPLPDSLRMNNPIFGELTVNMSVQEAYQYLSDFEQKKTWDKNIKDIRYDKGKINRAGTKHICVLEYGAMKFETVKTALKEEKLVYGEKTSSFPLVRDMVTYYTLNTDGAYTNIRMEIHYVLTPFFGKLFESIIKYRMGKIKQHFLTSFPKGK